MVVVMQEGASEAQIQHVMERLVALGFDIHRSTGVSRTVLREARSKVEKGRGVSMPAGLLSTRRAPVPA